MAAVSKAARIQRQTAKYTPCSRKANGRLTGSAFGRTLRALSEDEIFTTSHRYINPTSFTVDESIFILSIIIIGGMRNLWGSIVAAVFLVLLPEALRFVDMPNSVAANMRQIIYGGCLIFVMFRLSLRFTFNRE
jgi:ABC-type branched-subunit amino acid transport system permease subunit